MGLKYNRHVVAFFGALVLAVSGSVSAFAGLPRDVVFSAQDQDADVMTGLLVARGEAEMRAKARQILARADVIEVWAKGNAVHFRGNAKVTIGEKTFASETVTCTLDFQSCASIDSSSVSSETGTAATRPE